jgi:predicted methyltransferase
MTLFLLAPCDGGSGESIDLQVADALASPDRIAADRLNDPLRRPDLVLDFFGIERGMTVLDLFSGGGYYTEIVSRLVGPEGRVVAHNNEAYLAFARESLAGRFDGERLPNVQRVTAEADQLELPPDTFDAALAMLTWHDFYYLDEANGWPSIDEQGMVDKLCAVLKTGGVLGVSDHVAPTGSDPESSAQELHRIDPARIREDLESGCFTFEGELKALRNPGDDHSLPMFDPAVRGKTDRVVYRFRKKA